MDELKRIIIEPFSEFISEFAKRTPQLILLIVGVLIVLLDIPWKDVTVPVEYVVASFPVVIALVWLVWSFYSRRFLRYTQGTYFGVIWNWHWKRERRGEGTWTVSPINPQCPKDKTRLQGSAREGGKQFWVCDQCDQEYSTDMTLEEELRKIKHLVVGRASRFHGFRMGESQETGKLKK